MNIPSYQEGYFAKSSDELVTVNTEECLLMQVKGKLLKQWPI